MPSRGEGVRSAGHTPRLVTNSDWPETEWPYGQITRLQGKTPTRFADDFEAIRAELGADVVLSLERVWQCDVYRAGDGVHRAWLTRRREFDGVLRRLRGIFNRKHRGILRLEESLFGHGGARRVIANSEMVKREIVQFYGCPEELIDVVPNGVPAAQFRASAGTRETSRAALGLEPDSMAVLFVGSGWERKGLRFAIRAVEACANPQMRLLVAGRGNEPKHRSPAFKFLGEIDDLRALFAAGDILLLPTVYDPFSNACLEALAAGLPVITTRANGFAEVMTDRLHGSLVDNSADIEALRSALRFWSNTTRRAEARAELQRHALKFDTSRNVTRTLEILVQAAASAASTSGKIRNT